MTVAADRKVSKELMNYYPVVPLEERDRRWSRVRRRMSEQGIDCLVVWSSDRGYGTSHANMRYLLGIAPESIAGGIGLFPIEGDPVAFVDYPNYYDSYPAHLAYQDWITDVRPLAGMKPIADEVAELIDVYT
ncbi:MAG: aminopeptidase P family N-terminal domain-containing protein [Candidatus Caldarchaeum sp.]